MANRNVTINYKLDTSGEDKVQRATSAEQKLRQSVEGNATAATRGKKATDDLAKSRSDLAQAGAKASASDLTESLDRETGAITRNNRALKERQGRLQEFARDKLKKRQARSERFTDDGDDREAIEKNNQRETYRVAVQTARRTQRTRDIVEDLRQGPSRSERDAAERAQRRIRRERDESISTLATGENGDKRAKFLTGVYNDREQAEGERAAVQFRRRQTTAEEAAQKRINQIIKTGNAEQLNDIGRIEQKRNQALNEVAVTPGQRQEVNQAFDHQSFRRFRKADERVQALPTLYPTNPVEASDARVEARRKRYLQRDGLTDTNRNDIDRFFDGERLRQRDRMLDRALAPMREAMGFNQRVTGSVYGPLPKPQAIPVQIEAKIDAKTEQFKKLFSQDPRALREIEESVNRYKQSLRDVSGLKAQESELSKIASAQEKINELVEEEAASHRKASENLRVERDRTVEALGHTDAQKKQIRDLYDPQIKRTEEEEKNGPGGNKRRIILGLKDLSEGYGRGALIEGVDYLMSLSGSGNEGHGGKRGGGGEGAGFAGMFGNVAKGLGVSPLTLGLTAAGAVAGVAALKLGEFVGEEAKAASETVRTAQALGLTTNEFKRFTSIAELAGQDAKVIQEVAGSFANALAKPAEEGKQITLELSRMGVAVNDLQGHARSTGAVLSDFLEKLAAIPDVNKRLDLARNILSPEQFRSLQPVLNDLKALNTEVDKLRLADGSSTDKLAETEKKLIALHKATAQLKEDFAAIASPVVTVTLQAAGNLLEGNSQPLLPFLTGYGMLRNALGLKAPERPGSKTEKDPLSQAYRQFQQRQAGEGDAYTKSVSGRGGNIEALDTRLQQLQRERNEAYQTFATSGADRPTKEREYGRVQKLDPQIRNLQQQIEAIRNIPNTQRETKLQVESDQDTILAVDKPERIYGRGPQLEASLKHELDRIAIDPNLGPLPGDRKKRRESAIARNQAELKAADEELAARKEQRAFSNAQVVTNGKNALVEREFSTAQQLETLRAPGGEQTREGVVRAYEREKELAEQIRSSEANNLTLLKDRLNDETRASEELRIQQQYAEKIADADSRRQVATAQIAQNEQRTNAFISRLGRQERFDATERQVGFEQRLAVLQNGGRETAGTIAQGLRQQTGLNQLAAGNASADVERGYQEGEISYEQKRRELAQITKELHERDAEAQLSAAERLLSLEQQSRENAKQGAADLFRSISTNKSGPGAGAAEFFKAQGNKILENAFADTVGPILNKVGGKATAPFLPMLKELGLGDIFKGTIFDHPEKSAQEENTNALRELTATLKGQKPGTESPEEFPAGQIANKLANLFHLPASWRFPIERPRQTELPSAPVEPDVVPRVVTVPAPATGAEDRPTILRRNHPETGPSTPISVLRLPTPHITITAPRSRQGDTLAARHEIQLGTLDTLPAIPAGSETNPGAVTELGALSLLRSGERTLSAVQELASHKHRAPHITLSPSGFPVLKNLFAANNLPGEATDSPFTGMSTSGQEKQRALREAVTSTFIPQSLPEGEDTDPGLKPNLVKPELTPARSILQGGWEGFKFSNDLLATPGVLKRYLSEVPREEGGKAVDAFRQGKYLQAAGHLFAGMPTSAIAGDLVQAQMAVGNRAADEFKQGRYFEGAAHELAGAVPIYGPNSVDMADLYASGEPDKVSEATGRMAGFVFPVPFLGLPHGAKAAHPYVRGAVAHPKVQATLGALREHPALRAARTMLADQTGSFGPGSRVGAFADLHNPLFRLTDEQRLSAVHEYARRNQFKPEELKIQQFKGREFKGIIDDPVPAATPPVLSDFAKPFDFESGDASSREYLEKDPPPPINRFIAEGQRAKPRSSKPAIDLNDPLFRLTDEQRISAAHKYASRNEFTPEERKAQEFQDILTRVEDKSPGFTFNPLADTERGEPNIIPQERRAPLELDTPATLTPEFVAGLSADKQYAAEKYLGIKPYKPASATNVASDQALASAVGEHLNQNPVKPDAGYRDYYAGSHERSFALSSEYDQAFRKAAQPLQPGSAPHADALRQVEAALQKQKDTQLVAALTEHFRNNPIPPDLAQVKTATEQMRGYQLDAAYQSATGYGPKTENVARPNLFGRIKNVLADETGSLGPGSGRKPPTRVGRWMVDKALEKWTTGGDEELPDPKLIEYYLGEIYGGKDTEAANALRATAQDARAALAPGRKTVTLWRGTSPTIGLQRSSKMAASYSENRAAVEKYLANYSATGDVPKDAKIWSEEIPKDRIVAYHKQGPTDSFIPEEQEVIVAHKPFATDVAAGRPSIQSALKDESGSFDPGALTAGFSSLVHDRLGIQPVHVPESPFESLRHMPYPHPLRAVGTAIDTLGDKIAASSIATGIGPYTYQPIASGTLSKFYSTLPGPGGAQKQDDNKQQSRSLGRAFWDGTKSTLDITSFGDVAKRYLYDIPQEERGKSAQAFGQGHYGSAIAHGAASIPVIPGMAGDILGGQMELGNRAAEEFKQGRYGDALTHELLGAIPVYGAHSSEVADKFQSPDPALKAEAAGNMFGFLFPAFVPFAGLPMAAKLAKPYMRGALAHPALKAAADHPAVQATRNALSQIKERAKNADLADESGSLGPQARPHLTTEQRSALAKASMTHKFGVREQAISDQTEIELSKALDIPRTEDTPGVTNAPFDLQNDKLGVEVKTLHFNTNDKLTVKPDARARKDAEVARTGIKPYTVVADKRQSLDHPDYYMREGYGSFRIGNMQRVPSLVQLKALLKGESGYFNPAAMREGVRSLVEDKLGIKPIPDVANPYEAKPLPKTLPAQFAKAAGLTGALSMFTDAGGQLTPTREDAAKHESAAQADNLPPAFAKLFTTLPGLNDSLGNLDSATDRERATAERLITATDNLANQLVKAAKKAKSDGAANEPGQSGQPGQSPSQPGQPGGSTQPIPTNIPPVFPVGSGLPPQNLPGKAPGSTTQDTDPNGNPVILTRTPSGLILRQTPEQQADTPADLPPAFPPLYQTLPGLEPDRVANDDLGSATTSPSGFPILQGEVASLGSIGGIFKRHNDPDTDIDGNPIPELPKPKRTPDGGHIYPDGNYYPPGRYPMDEKGPLDGPVYQGGTAEGNQPAAPAPSPTAGAVDKMAGALQGLAGIATMAHIGGAKGQRISAGVMAGAGGLQSAMRIIQSARAQKHGVVASHPVNPASPPQPAAPGGLGGVIGAERENTQATAGNTQATGANTKALADDTSAESANTSALGGNTNAEKENTAAIRDLIAVSKQLAEAMANHQCGCGDSSQPGKQPGSSSGSGPLGKIGGIAQKVGGVLTGGGNGSGDVFTTDSKVTGYNTPGDTGGNLNVPFFGSGVDPLGMGAGLPTADTPVFTSDSGISYGTPGDLNSLPTGTFSPDDISNLGDFSNGELGQLAGDYSGYGSTLTPGELDTIGGDPWRTLTSGGFGGAQSGLDSGLASLFRGSGASAAGGSTMSESFGGLLGSGSGGTSVAEAMFPNPTAPPFGGDSGGIGQVFDGTNPDILGPESPIEKLPGSTPGLGKGIGAGNILGGALGGFQAFQGIKGFLKHGDNKSLTSGVAGGLTMAAALDPEPISKAVLGIAALAANIVSAFMPSAQELRKKELARETFAAQKAALPYNQPGLNLEMTTSGRTGMNDENGNFEALSAFNTVQNGPRAVGWLDPDHSANLTTTNVRTPNQTNMLDAITQTFGYRASGGAVTPHRPVIVGERGPEVFDPASYGTIIPNSKLPSDLFNPSRATDLAALASPARSSAVFAPSAVSQNAPMVQAGHTFNITLPISAMDSQDIMRRSKDIANAISKEVASGATGRLAGDIRANVYAT